MQKSNSRKSLGRGGLFHTLGRLFRDNAGNTIAIVAAGLFVLVGLIGGGVDASRLYLVKTRLQQACDAGALSGRKAMAGSTWNTASQGAASQLFTANFASGSYGTSNLNPSFTESDGIVTGTASVSVPMTLMRVFGFSAQTMNVNCTARMEIPNTDVMFVLDTTGSMNCPPEDTSGGSCPGTPVEERRITALRSAVKCFYETLARQDIDDEDCGSTPGGGAGTAQIRFGFVPYSTNVNVGRLLPNDYLVDNWSYQTRRANMAVPPQKTENIWEIYDGGSLSQADCLKFMNNQAFGTFAVTPSNSGGPEPSPTVETSFQSDGAATDGGTYGEWGWSRLRDRDADPTWGSWSAASDTSGSTKSCRRKRTNVITYYEEKFQNWTYGVYDIDVSGLKAGGSSWNAGFTIPGSASDPDTQSVRNTNPGNDVLDQLITWDGCIEERATVESNDFDPIPEGALDLDIDLVPDVNEDSTRWKPALDELIYRRSQDSRPGYACGTRAEKLTTWTTTERADDFRDYVNGLTPNGATYHDIGLLWGARLMSPTGIFASENALTPSGRAIDRHLIFMTDGDTNANATDYAAYGLPIFDHRQTVNAPSKADMDNQVNWRFAALCEEVKARNITLWVISFGAGIDEDTEERLEQCATDDRHFFDSDSAADLIGDFSQIASEIADLRLTS